MKTAMNSQIPLFDLDFILSAHSDRLTVLAPTANTHTLRAITRVSTDSRTVQPGDLFVCIKGDHFDGHDYVASAIQAGASAVLGEKDRLGEFVARAAHCALVGCESGGVTEAFRALAHAWRKTFSIPVIAIAGAVGKTTTKEMFASISKAAFSDPESVLKTAGSENGFLGIPITLLKLRAHHRIAIIEIGIDAIGAMQSHLEIIAPTCATVTAIGPEHLENLIDLETVTREEGLALVHTHSQNFPIIVMTDDPYLEPFARKLSGPQTFQVSLASKNAPLNSGPTSLVGTLAEKPEQPELEDGLHQALAVEGMGLSRQTLTLPVPGLHNSRNALGAIALARSVGMQWSSIQSGLEGFRPAFGRSEVSQFSDGTLIYRDYYNANPSSVEAALQSLSSLKRQRRGKLWLCLGDMLELGAGEEVFHRNLSGPITHSGAAGVLLYGPRMQWLHSELTSQGFPGEISHFGTHAALFDHLRKLVQPGDHVLLKGSRGMKMEEVWKLLEPTLSS